MRGRNEWRMVPSFRSEQLRWGRRKQQWQKILFVFWDHTYRMSSGPNPLQMWASGNKLLRNSSCSPPSAKSCHDRRRGLHASRLQSNFPTFIWLLSTLLWPLKMQALGQWANSLLRTHVISLLVYNELLYFTLPQLHLQKICFS